jgi:peptide/nickel transport system permease protein
MKDKKSDVTKKPTFLHELFHTKKLAAFGLCLLIFFLLVALLADFIAPVTAVDGQIPTSVLEKLQPPSLTHPLGTDSVGRDLLSYMIYGCRTSVILGIVCTVLSTLVSLVIGVASAVIGGWFDLIVQRFVDAWQCVPGMLIMLILMSILGNGLIQLIIVIAVPAGIGGSRMVRSAAISVKDSGYSKMSTMLGGSQVWKMVQHVTPNILPIIIMNMAGSLGGVIMMEASMNFLGFGVSVNTPSWGALLSGQGRSNMYVAPWLAMVPGIAIAIMVFASAMLGDGVRDIMDPRLKGGVGSYAAGKLKKIVEQKKQDLHML